MAAFQACKAFLENQLPVQPKQETVLVLQAQDEVLNGIQIGHLKGFTKQDGMLAWSKVREPRRLFQQSRPPHEPAARSLPETIGRAGPRALLCQGLKPWLHPSAQGEVLGRS